MKVHIIKKIVASVTGIVGFGVLTFTAVPIFMFNAGSTKAINYISPVPEKSLKINESDAQIDYTKASNWFEDTGTTSRSHDSILYYNLSVPSLGIKNATVSVGGEDLSDSLIHYKGTALPGKTGNAVIFGHSILPQFYNPKDYLAIFSTLPTIQKGEKIEVLYDGIQYTYQVEDKFEVLPTDLEILAQNKTDSYITLVTCTPPGHPLRPRRLIVRAKLIPYTSV